MHAPSIDSRCREVKPSSSPHEASPSSLSCFVVSRACISVRAFLLLDLPLEKMLPDSLPGRVAPQPAFGALPTGLGSVDADQALLTPPEAGVDILALEKLGVHLLATLREIFVMVVTEMVPNMILATKRRDAAWTFEVVTLELWSVVSRPVD